MTPEEAREIVRLYGPVSPASRSTGMITLLHNAHRTLRAQREQQRVQCPLAREGWRTTRWPGSRDQCPGCGRIVYTRADGTCRPHTRPTRAPNQDDR